MSDKRRMEAVTAKTESDGDRRWEEEKDERVMICQHSGFGKMKKQKDKEWGRGCRGGEVGSGTCHSN